MVKTTKRSKAKANRDTVEERVQREERRMLERGVRHQRKVRELARRLQRETAAADAALREVGRWVMERESPAEKASEL